VAKSSVITATAMVFTTRLAEEFSCGNTAFIGNTGKNNFLKKIEFI